MCEDMCDVNQLEVPFLESSASTLFKKHVYQRNTALFVKHERRTGREAEIGPTADTAPAPNITLAPRPAVRW